MMMAGSELLDSTDAPAGSSDQYRTLKTGGQGIEKITLNAASTPKVDKPLIAMMLTLTNGVTTTIDLTNVQALAMPISSARLKDLTGAKVKAFMFATPNTNVGTVNIAPGGSNPYLLYGSGNDITLDKGRVEMGAYKGVDSGLSAVGSGAKNIDITCSNTGDKLYLELWAGT